MYLNRCSQIHVVSPTPLGEELLGLASVYIETLAEGGSVSGSYAHLSYSQMIDNGNTLASTLENNAEGTDCDWSLAIPDDDLTFGQIIELLDMVILEEVGGQTYFLFNAVFSEGGQTIQMPVFGQAGSCVDISDCESSALLCNTAYHVSVDIDDKFCDNYLREIVLHNAQTTV